MRTGSHRPSVPLPLLARPRRALLLLLGALPLLACRDSPDLQRSPPDALPRPGISHYREEGARRAPTAGVDLDPRLLRQLAGEEALAVTDGAGGIDLELGGDRPAVKLPVPRIGLAATASFALGEGRQGWITRLPAGARLPSPAYGGGRIYVSGGFAGTDFYALDARTGLVIWDRQDLDDNGPTAPIVEEEDVIFNTESCTLIVLDARTGRTRWSKWLGDPTLAQPALAQGMIFAAHPAKEGGFRLAGLRLSDGRALWRRAVDDELLSAPVANGDSVYAVTVRGTIYRFEGQSGRRLWAQRLAATSAPWIAGNRVYLTRTQGRGQEALLALDAASGEVVATLHQTPARYLHDVPRSTANNEAVWAFEGSRPILALGRLLDTMGGAVSARHPGSGRDLWRRRDGRAAGRRNLTPAVLAGSQIIVASRRGEVTALDIDTGMTIWSYDVGRAIAASPIVARGWVYLAGVDGSVIGLEVGGPDLDGWRMWGGGPAHNGAPPPDPA